MIKMNNKKMTKKALAVDYRNNGDSVKEISKKLSLSTSTIYRYLSEHYDETRFPDLKREIKQELLGGDFRKYIHELSYKDICLIRRKITFGGWDRETKIKAILDHFKHYSILGLYPENINKNDIKRAFYKKAKKVHPDVNKDLDKSGTEFIEVYESYSYLLSIY